jgi:hypothetical protein
MNPEPKISATILAFGDELFRQLPPNPSTAQFEAVLRIVVLVWNSVTIDQWHNNTQMQDRLLADMTTLPDEGKLFMRRLVKRKKKKYGTDQRAVGDYSVRIEKGEFIVRCEARGTPEPGAGGAT